MARILNCWELGNGLAYIGVLMAGARALDKAGHENRFALRDLGAAERLLGDHYPYYQAPTTVLQPVSRMAQPMTYADLLINLGWGEPGAVTGRVVAWRNLLDHVQPDLMRCAYAPGALLAARGTGIRTVAMGLGFMVPPNVKPLPLWRSWAKDHSPERMAEREQRVLDGMNQGLDKIGAPRLASIGALYAETGVREIYSYPALDDYGPRKDVQYLGNFQTGLGAAPEWPTATGKRIFAFLTLNKSTPKLLEALAATRQPVLVYLPGAPVELQQRYANSNLLLTDRALNLRATAAACDVGVNHGEHLVAAALLAAGKPQLNLPNFMPERVTAEKLATLGAGLRSSAESPELSADLRRLLEDAGLADKAQSYARTVAGLDTDTALRRCVENVTTLLATRP